MSPLSNEDVAHVADSYPESRLQRVLAEDPRVAELGIRVVRLEQGGFALSGEVHSQERCRQIEQVLAEEFPDLPIRLDIAVSRVHEPDEVEEV